MNPCTVSREKQSQTAERVAFVLRDTHVKSSYVKAINDWISLKRFPIFARCKKNSKTYQTYDKVTLKQFKSFPIKARLYTMRHTISPLLQRCCCSPSSIALGTLNIVLKTCNFLSVSLLFKLCYLCFVEQTMLAEHNGRYIVYSWVYTDSIATILQLRYINIA